MTPPPQPDVEMKEEDEGVHNDDMHDDAIDTDVLDREVAEHGAKQGRYSVMSRYFAALTGEFRKKLFGW